MKHLAGIERSTGGTAIASWIPALSVWFLLSCHWLAASPGTDAYLGSEACGECHEEIYQEQSQSLMARTWRQAGQGLFKPGYERTIQEDSLSYRVSAGPNGLTFSVQESGKRRLEVPVKALTGGERFGVGFLLEIESIDEQPLIRPALLEARYMQDTRHDRLVRAPGHNQLKPNSPLSGMGRVLKPKFQERCLTCHGSPDHTPSRAPGVHCERCHGPGARHLQALEQGEDDLGVVNPAAQGPAAVVEFCGQCHSGFSDPSQPSPEDLLISDQARALSLSECFVQSGGGLSCLQCHNPHQDAPASDPRYDATCKSCHDIAAGRAGACPVNQEGGCVKCHMPKVQMGDLHLLDHWIRVPYDQVGKHSLTPNLPPSRVPPRRVFLRMLVVRNAALANQLRQQISQGAAFSDLARQHSIDASAKLGGFIGARVVARLPANLQSEALKLDFGEVGSVVDLNGEYALIQRMPRDFRWQAQALESQGTRLLAEGKVELSIARLEAALEVNPLFLKGYHGLATAHGARRDLEKLIATLTLAQRLFPQDPKTAFLLARAYSAAGRDSLGMQWLRRALGLDPEMTAAHLLLGNHLYSRQRWGMAADHFRKAAQLNPLSAAAYYNLGQALRQSGQDEEAARWLRLARSLEGETRITSSP